MKHVRAANDEDSQGPTSARVLQAGAQLFREQGYAASTTRELSARLGINKASLYYHISSKEELLCGICLESLRRVHSAVSSAVESKAQGPERIRALCRAHLGSMLADLDMHATMLLELKALTGMRYEGVRKARDAYEDFVVQTVASAQRAGALRSDMAAKHIGLGLLNLLNWTIEWYQPGGELTPDELAEILSELFLNGAVNGAVAVVSH